MARLSWGILHDGHWWDMAGLHSRGGGGGGVEVEVDVVNHIIFSTHVARGYVGFGAEGPGRRRLGSLARMASDQ